MSEVVLKVSLIFNGQLNTKSLQVCLLIVFFMLLSPHWIWSQSISGTGTSVAICGDCNPTGWSDANPSLDGTPDISNKDQAGGQGSTGELATWSNAVLPLPPNGDARWITLRDKGSGATEEYVTTTMTSLVVGKIYKIVISSMTSTTNSDGGSGGTESYAGTFIEDYDIQIGSNARRTISGITQDTWGNHTILFVANATSETLTIYPGSDSGYNGTTGTIGLIEMVHISVDAITGLEASDTDGDSIDDAVDIDDDNDGILDTTESGGNQPDGDEDGDGIVNYQDVSDDGTGDGSTTDYTDTNADGIPDVYDFDQDGVPNHLDLDSDNDGILDSDETTDQEDTFSGGNGGSTHNFTIDGVISTRIDLDYVDNEVEITINSTDLHPNNILEFQNVTLTGGEVKIVFDSDGAFLTDPWISNTNGLPRVRIDIDENGVVSISGTRTSSSTSLEALRTQDNSAFNTITFSTGTNSFTIVNPNGTGADAIGGTVFTHRTIDTDGDGVANQLDIDSDNDGITDNLEAQSTATFTAPSGIDTDKDGLDDAYDLDCNPCGAITGVSISPVNSDTDSVADYLDIDSDDDGIPDNVEAQTTLGYTAPNGIPGVNGLDSAYDFTDSYSSTGLNSTLANTDGSGEPDFRDSDSDEDGTSDIQENGDSDSTVSGIDTDGDGLDDNFEGSSTNDVDPNDEINNPSTDLPDVDGDVNTGGDVDFRDTIDASDTDGDGIENLDDIDDDNDGILDADETNDQVDSFSGGNGGSTHSFSIEDIKSTRIDFDYVDNEAVVTINGFGLHPNNILEFQNVSLSGGDVRIVLDSDGAFLTSPWLANSNGLPRVRIDINEFGVVTITGTRTTSSTSLELLRTEDFTSFNTISFITGTNTMIIENPNGTGADAISGTIYTCINIDTDGDGIPNHLDLDSDDDGILDNIEAQSTSGYVALSGVDTDNDGLDDAYDSDCTPCGSITGTSISPINSDTDTQPDYLDIDTDNDGIPDNVEAQTTVGYTIPNGVPGANGLDSAYENNDTINATGINPNNHDMADEPDYRDADSDNDGTNDEDESGITLNPGTLGTDSDGDGLDDIYEGSDSTAGELYDVNDEIDDPVNNLLDADGDGASTGDVDYRDDFIFIDSDEDGIQDSDDVDDDNDGILDTLEDAEADADSDGIPNSLDIDSDDDGIPDNVEAQETIGYIAPSGSGSGMTDANSNGLDDNYETAQGGTDIVPVNTDDITGNNTDALPDYLDTDSDGDGTLDIDENGNSFTLLGVDTDGDGLDDAFEGVLNDNDVNDDINNPATDLPDFDGDVNTTDGAQPNAAEYNDVDYRDIDDDTTAPNISGNILWLRADIGVTGVAAVTNWEDQSSNALNATNTGNAPVKLGDGTATDGLNFNPTIDFTEVSSQDLEITGGGVLGNSTLYDHLWVYAVSASNSTTNDSYIFSNAVSGGDVEFQVPTASSLFSFDTSTGTILTATSGAVASTFNLWNAGSSSATSTPSGTNKALYRDGLLIGSNSTGGSTQFTSNNSASFIGSDANGANFFDGQIAEVLVFNTVPTSSEQQQIQSYLAIKYGITLDQTDNDATIDEGDYVLSDFSTIVWDESANTTYHNDVTGIGRDVGMSLHQKQSKSINSSAALTIGLNQIEANNGSNSNAFNDKNFLMWGHNGIAINSGNTTATTLLCESEKQLDRVWKIVETGSVQDVEVAVVKSTIDGALTRPSSETIIFKVADDASFTSNVKYIGVDTRNINGVDHYIVNYDFEGTKYFTYSEVLGIFWNGDSVAWTGGNAWTGGSGTANAPADDTVSAGIDGQKVLVIDSETSLNNATLAASANVECVWVRSDSKLVIPDGYYLEFDKDFVLDGEIRLEGDAQLVQSHTGVSNITGNGVIYRDQDASVPSVYRYHYWSSPVTAALGNTSYTVSEVMFDGTTATSENSSLLPINWVSYDGSISSLNGAPTNPITISNFWIYTFFNGTTRDDWAQTLETGSIDIGNGYIMKSTGRSPQGFTFYGSPNDGTYSKVLTAGTTSLLGNPYPSAIDTQEFIADNSTVIDGTLYFWEHQGESSTTTQVEGHAIGGYIGGYSQRNAVMGVAANSVVDGTAGLGDGTYTAPSQYISVGQGFFVSAPSDKGGTLVFENSQRAANTDNYFFRSENGSNDIPRLKIGMDYINDSNTELHRQLGINFKNGNSFEYESGYDSNIFDLHETDIYWNFPDLNHKLIIAGVGTVTADLQIPIGIDTDSDHPLTFMIDHKENMNGYTVYIGDLLTGLLWNLEDPVTIDLPKGSYPDRFVILFGGEALSDENVEFLSPLNVYFNSNTDQINIRNNNNSVIEKVQLFNILGQRIETWTAIDFSNVQTQLDVMAPSGIYIVKLDTNKGEITKKILID